MSETSVVRPFIDGAPYASELAVFQVINPATEATAYEVADADEATVDTAVASATRSQKEWASLAPTRRGDLIAAWADRLESSTEALARVDTECMGRPISDSIAEVRGTAGRARYWAGMSDKINGDYLPVVPGHVSFTVREPLGVIAAIIPWNGPTSSFVGRVSASLAAGNSVIVKPSEYTPVTAVRLAELAAEAGIPDGVVNVVTGQGNTGATLSRHPGVAGICFTGSVGTGRAIASAAAPTFKKTVLELGGKSPNIIFPDADLAEAIRGSLWGVFYNSGQVCCAGTRLIVHDSVADEVIGRLAEEAARLTIGDPLEPSTKLGPLVSARQRDRVVAYLDRAASDGATDMTGSPLEVPSKGWYVAPHIFAVDPRSSIGSEEVFGPVLSVLRFETEEEAISLANATPYGLSATVWTSDLGRMHRVCDKVEAAVVWGNTMRVFHPALPFGGFKDSGTGSTSGAEAIEGLTRLKRVSLRVDPSVPAPGWTS